MDKPIRHGWYREYVLRDDIARRKDAHVFLEILDACGSSEWGLTKREIEEQWERVTWSKDYWQWPGFRRIGKRAYRRLSVRAKKYFGHYEVRWNPWQGSVRRYHCHVPEYYFIPKYTKAYVTHLQSVDSEIDSKISRLENQLLSDELYPYSWWAANGLTNKFMRKWEIRNERRMTKIALQQYDEECYDRWAYKKVSY
ncbi:MAG: hypothetical protein R8G66_04190 [Cytophagales bacterium]|nr:hypothetical protein [Cytophagales bacterium]